MVMGSEGRLGIITEVKLRITPLPEQESFHVIFFPDWNTGLQAVRAMAQARLQLSMMRLSNTIETFTQLKLAGSGMAIRHAAPCQLQLGEGLDGAAWPSACWKNTWTCAAPARAKPCSPLA
jgi:alkyldihydroxyacetonephosphate synthase